MGFGFGGIDRTAIAEKKQAFWQKTGVTKSQIYSSRNVFYTCWTVGQTQFLKIIICALF